MNTPNTGFFAVIAVIAIWQFFWKVIAVWRSAREGQKVWFGVLLFLFFFNTLGLPEIVYLFWFAKHKLTVNEIHGWFEHVKKKARRHKS